MKTKSKKDHRLKGYLEYCPCGNKAIEVNCLIGRCARCKAIEEAYYPQKQAYAMSK